MGFMALNWLWIALATVVAFYFLRRKSGAHTAGHGTDPRKLLDGPRHGGHPGHGVQPASDSKANEPEAAIDPVGKDPVSAAKALTSLHPGKVYNFARKETRDRFEASPEKYAGKVVGHAVPGSDAQPEHWHRHGC